VLTTTYPPYRPTLSVDPPDDRLLVSAVAGALWPLLVVGLVELGLVVVCAEALSSNTEAIGVFG
jgi:hypothetical protein